MEQRFRVTSLIDEVADQSLSFELLLLLAKPFPLLGVERKLDNFIGAPVGGRCTPHLSPAAAPGYRSAACHLDQKRPPCPRAFRRFLLTWLSLLTAASPAFTARSTALVSKSGCGSCMSCCQSRSASAVMRMMFNPGRISAGPRPCERSRV